MRRSVRFYNDRFSIRDFLKNVFYFILGYKIVYRIGSFDKFLGLDAFRNNNILRVAVSSFNKLIESELFVDNRSCFFLDQYYHSNISFLPQDMVYKLLKGDSQLVFLSQCFDEYFTEEESTLLTQFYDQKGNLIDYETVCHPACCQANKFCGLDDFLFHCAGSKYIFITYMSSAILDNRLASNEKYFIEPLIHSNSFNYNRLKSLKSKLIG